MKYDLRLTAQSINEEREKAVSFIDGNRIVWIPRRLLTWRDNGKAFCPTAEVPLWFARQNGLVSTARDMGH